MQVHEKVVTFLRKDARKGKRAVTAGPLNRVASFTKRPFPIQENAEPSKEIKWEKNKVEIV
jgi:hypothetical protein